MNEDIQEEKQTPDTENVEQTQQDEKEARQMGWTPKEDWHGDESLWVDAQVFLKRGREINPILRKSNEKLLGKLNTLETRLREQDLTIREFGEMYKKMSERAYERAMTDVKKQIREARKDDNDEQVERLEEQLESLKEDSKNIQVPTTAKPSLSNPEGERILQEWKDDNTWYDRSASPDLFYLAEGMGRELASEHPELLGKREFLDELSKRVKRAAPDRFAKKRTPSMVEGDSPSGGGGKRGGKTFADLPSEAKAQYERQAKVLPGFKKEDYARYYFEQE